MFATTSVTAPVARPAPAAPRASSVRAASTRAPVSARFAARGRAPASLRRASPSRSVSCAAGVDLRRVIERLCDAEDLSEAEAQASMDALLDAEPEQIAAFLVLLRAKGETGAEMAGLARAMKARGVPVHAGDDVLDIVGTGGDDAGTVNISTGSCILAAAAGARVAKHGNRSVSSLCGQRGRPGSVGRRGGPRPGGRRGVRQANRHGLHVRAEVPPVDEGGGARAQETESAHRV
jgi:anthranilate phosphoribosyltransferase